jgi:hypothetical protein
MASTRSSTTRQRRSQREASTQTPKACELATLPRAAADHLDTRLGRAAIDHQETT